MDYRELLSFAHALADEAQPLLQKGFRTAGAAAQLKSDHSPVTVTDRTVEQRLRALINERYPLHGIIGEEEESYQAQAEYRWILDPIDGTRAFACGIPTFGTLIALMHHGEIVLGMMQQAFSGERWGALKGGEALEYKHSGQHILHTSTCTRLEAARFATTSPYLFNEQEKLLFEVIRLSTAIQTYGGDCYNYAMLAAGHIDLVVEAGLKPYDIAALVPIIEGAGGIVTDWQGREIRLDLATLNIIASANPALHAQALEVMNEASRGSLR